MFFHCKRSNSNLIIDWKAFFDRSDFTKEDKKINKTVLKLNELKNLADEKNLPLPFKQKVRGGWQTQTKS